MQKQSHTFIINKHKYIHERKLYISSETTCHTYIENGKQNHEIKLIQTFQIL